MFFECQPKKAPGQPSSIDCTPVPRFFLLLVMSGRLSGLGHLLNRSVDAMAVRPSKSLEQ